MCATKYSEQKFNIIEKRISTLLESINQLSENILLLYSRVSLLEQKNTDSYSIKEDES